MSTVLLVPHSDVDERVADEHFEAEVSAAREFGVAVAFVDHETVVDGRDGLGTLPVSGDVVYRGWMVPPPAYAAMEASLTARGLRLRTGAAASRRGRRRSGQ